MKFFRLLVLMLLWISSYAYAQMPKTETAHYQELQQIDGKIDNDGMDLDNDTLVLGYGYENVDGNVEQGAVYVYRLNAVTGLYEKKQRLISSDGIDNDHFGTIVAIDEDIIAVQAQGNYWYGTEGDLTTLIYIFQKNADGSFKQTQKIIEPNEAVGKIFLDKNRMVCGNGYIYELQSGDFVKTDTIDLSKYNNYAYISSFDGNTIAVSHMGETVDGKDAAGAVYIFQPDGTGKFKEIQRIVADQAKEFGYFGKSVNISGDTMVIVLKENPDTDPNILSLYVYKFNRSSKQFEKYQSITLPNGGCIRTALYDNKLIVGRSENVMFFERSDDLAPFVLTKTQNIEGYTFVRSTRMGEKRALVNAADFNNNKNTIFVYGTDATVPLVPVFYLLGM